MLLRKSFLLAALLSGCSYVPAIGLTPHKVDIQQGNLVTPEMVAKVQPGMSKSQVRFALGTPLVTDPFHPDRWDYVFMQQRRGVVTQQKRLVIVFEKDQVAKIEGDLVPPKDAAADKSKP